MGKGEARSILTARSIVRRAHRELHDPQRVNSWALRTIGMAAWTCSASAFAHPTRLNLLRSRQLRDVMPGDPAEGRGATDAVLTEAAG